MSSQDTNEETFASAVLPPKVASSVILYAHQVTLPDFYTLYYFARKFLPLKIKELEYEKSQNRTPNANITKVRIDHKINKYRELIGDIEKCMSDYIKKRKVLFIKEQEILNKEHVKKTEKFQLQLLQMQNDSNEEEDEEEEEEDEDDEEDDEQDDEEDEEEDD